MVSHHTVVTVTVDILLAIFHYHCIVAKYPRKVFLFCVVGALLVEERKKEEIVPPREKMEKLVVGLFSQLLVMLTGRSTIFELIDLLIFYDSV